MPVRVAEDSGIGRERLFVRRTRAFACVAEWSSVCRRRNRELVGRVED